MKKTFTLMLLSAFCTVANAQTTATPTTQPYGKVEQADLEMKVCDFEKDANAEVLFDQGKVTFDLNYHVNLARHTRIKIFNDNGKDHASVKIEYDFGDGENIYDIQAQTINQTDGKPEITKVDKKLIYTQVIDKFTKAAVFTFPNVKPGSIIEFKYVLSNDYAGLPNWYFQSDIPTRYSEFSADIPNDLHYKNLVRVSLTPLKQKTDNQAQLINMALANVPSLHNEPYMTSRRDNLQHISYQLLSYVSNAGITHSFEDNWQKIGENETNYDDFGQQFRRKLDGEDTILNKAKGLKTNDQKIAYIFNTVKNTVKWNNSYTRYTDDGTSLAWKKKTGNSTEINLMVYHLLTKAGIKAYPLIASTRKNGKVNPAFPSRFQFNTSVTYVPVDTTNYYILDATNKYNFYKDVPSELLNSYGLLIDKDDKKYDMVVIENQAPVRNVVMLSADIKPDGKMEGSAQISSFGYYRRDNVESYMTDGEKKYIDKLKDGDNNLNITSLKMENLAVDSLPLTQNVVFNLALTGSDDNYIYFKPNLFTSLGANPFLNENRSSDIDFGFRDNYVITGTYKMPAGYKVDAMPKSVSMLMPDQTISFKRIAGEQDGSIMVRYVIDFKKSMFFKENYAELHDFFKKMYEMMNEQVVLKKG
jgi:hypothetical protein